MISVIVPVYKVEDYLERCITSIVNQTYRNLEIILVDDGSPDHCGEICDEWSRKDSRIKVIHKENGGLSDARNAGMKIATGEYTVFVDSDDWIHKDMLKVLMEVQEETKGDIVECKAQICFSKENDMEIGTLSEIDKTSFNTEESLQCLINEYPLHQTVWNKLYRTEVIKDILFPYGKYHEDEFWTYQVFARAEKVVYVDVSLYYYFQRKDSIMGQAFSLKRLDALEGRFQRCLFMKQHFEKLELLAKKSVLFLCLYYLQKAFMNSDVEIQKRCIVFVRNMISKMGFSLAEIRSCSIKERIWIYIAKKNVSAAAKIRNKLKIGIQ